METIANYVLLQKYFGLRILFTNYFLSGSILITHTTRQTLEEYPRGLLKGIFDIALGVTKTKNTNLLSLLSPYLEEYLMVLSLYTLSDAGLV